MNLARAGITRYDATLGITKYLSQEQDVLPWDSVEVTFGHLSNMLFGTNNYTLWQVGELPSAKKQSGFYFLRLAIFLHSPFQ